AVMLSGETSVGDFPEIVIETMAKVITQVERTSYPYYSPKDGVQANLTRIPDAICGSSIHLAKNTNASAIAVMTSSGYTAFEISSNRSNSDRYVFRGNTKLIKLLCSVWGVRVFVYSKFESSDRTIQGVNGLLKELNLVS